MEAILSNTLTEKETCFHDIYTIRMPEKTCPFGCRRIKTCPYDWDAARCPHNLETKTLEELSDYANKSFLYSILKVKDDDGTEKPDVDMKAMLPDNVIEGIKNMKLNQSGQDR